MITAIDTNILLDIFFADPKFGELSAQSLRSCLKKGDVFACDIVWAETATAFENQKEFLYLMDEMSIYYSSINLTSTLIAADRWRTYRRRGGKKERIIPDFLIGAHAFNQANQLLTRDKDHHKYFPSLEIVNPTLL